MSVFPRKQSGSSESRDLGVRRGSSPDRDPGNGTSPLKFPGGRCGKVPRSGPPVLTTEGPSLGPLIHDIPWRTPPRGPPGWRERRQEGEGEGDGVGSQSGEPESRPPPTDQGGGAGDPLDRLGSSHR